MHFLNSIEEDGPGNYVIIELDTFVLTLTKHQLRVLEVWDIYFDGDRSKAGVGFGIVLRYPTKEINKFAFWFTWNCTNNTTKYEALWLRLKQATNMRIKCIQMFGDFELVINQVIDKWTTKHHYLRAYKNKVLDLFESLYVINYMIFPSIRNQEVDVLAQKGSKFDPIE